MKKGGGKAKGSQFERVVCKQLSLWVTDGRKEDCFWRSAMSGGRATVGRKKNLSLGMQAGDICSVSPEGHSLTSIFYIELKFYKDLGIDRFLLGSGTLFNFWCETWAQANHYKRAPMLIAKQNQFPPLVITTQRAMSYIVNPDPCDVVKITRKGVVCEMRELEKLLKLPYRGKAAI